MSLSFEGAFKIMETYSMVHYATQMTLIRITRYFALVTMKSALQVDFCIFTPSSHSVDKKCGNATNWEASRVSLKSGCNSTFIYAIYTAGFGLNSKMSHLIQQKCAILHAKYINYASKCIRNSENAHYDALCYKNTCHRYNSLFCGRHNAGRTSSRFLHVY